MPFYTFVTLLTFLSFESFLLFFLSIILLKLKKWASRIVSHFIQRYGNPRYASTEYEAFANYFKSNIASGLLGPVMNCLALKSRGIFVTGMYVRTLFACVEQFFSFFLFLLLLRLCFLFAFHHN